MPRRTRQALIAAFVALHATAMLCGACLHELPGLGHAAASSASDGFSASTPSGSHASADDCPVCHLLSLGQWLADPAPSTSVAAVAIRGPERPPGRPFTSDHPPRPSRAPPAVPA